ncbi:hypothetical protein [Polaribacter sp. Hel1_85]|uniref:hypothetical protein n=1 Tax=Polaribacter sp. Hel1_85 TaxID=1250005 RepID=UPI00052D2833|nr:hypothetical protein [Polaribacter sp. Hel1_85]KGL62920.1 hypothetical protein PHEL85_2716 [Polaribacter sp. Hel1_85]
MSNYDLIRQAILDRECITCSYNGYVRKMTPHVIGTKNGNKQALFYQYGGNSSSGLSSNPFKNWRCIEISKIKDLKLNSDLFQTANNHSKKQTCVDNIDVEVNC